eukprot:gene11769-11860_t
MQKYLVSRPDANGPVFGRRSCLLALHRWLKRAAAQAKSDAPAQLCTFSWALMTEQKTSQIVEGSFLLAPQASNMQVYQGSGFAYALSAPIILCNNMK